MWASLNFHVTCLDKYGTSLMSLLETIIFENLIFASAIQISPLLYVNQILFSYHDYKIHQ